LLKLHQREKFIFHDVSNFETNLMRCYLIYSTQAMGQIIIEKNKMDAKNGMHAVS